MKITPEIVARNYALLGNHRAVARVLDLPIHYVMYILGLMPESLYLRVNGDA